MKIIISSTLEDLERRSEHMPDSYYARRHSILKHNREGKKTKKERLEEMRERYRKQQEHDIEVLRNSISKNLQYQTELKNLLSKARNTNMVTQINKLKAEYERTTSNLNILRERLQKLLSTT